MEKEDGWEVLEGGWIHHQRRWRGQWTGHGHSIVVKGCGASWSHEGMGRVWVRGCHQEGRGAAWWLEWWRGIQGGRQGGGCGGVAEKSNGDNKGGGVVEKQACLGAFHKGLQRKVVCRWRGGV